MTSLYNSVYTNTKIQLTRGLFRSSIIVTLHVHILMDIYLADTKHKDNQFSIYNNNTIKWKEDLPDTKHKDNNCCNQNHFQSS
jgi:hypothetical protein